MGEVRESVETFAQRGDPVAKMLIAVADGEPVPRKRTDLRLALAISFVLGTFAGGCLMFIALR